MLGLGSEAIWLLVCPASHTFVHDPMAKKKKLAKLIRLEKLDILACSIFIGHGYLWYGGCDRRDSHGIHYHTYLNPSEYDLKDAEAIFYGLRRAVIKKPATASRKRAE